MSQSHNLPPFESTHVAGLPVLPQEDWNGPLPDPLPLASPSALSPSALSPVTVSPSAGAPSAAIPTANFPSASLCQATLRPEGARSRRVLLLGNDDRVLLAVARSLGRRGIRSELAWQRPTSVARRSRYIRRIHTLPPYDAADRGWLAALRQLVMQSDYDLVVPCNESSVVPLQRHAAELADLGGFYLLEPEVFRQAFDKPRCNQLAAELNLALPRTCPNDPAWSNEALIAALGLPIIAKPRATFKDQGVSHVVRRLNSLADLAALRASPLGEQYAQFQECFLGTGMGVELLAHQGRIVYAFQHQRLHESMEYGSSYRKSVPLDPELLDASARLIAALHYTGVAMVEFIQNLEAGRWVFLEINGRFWGSLPLAVAAGADFPYFLYQMLVEGRRQFPAGYRVGVHCRNLLLDFQGLRSRSRANGLPRSTSFGALVDDLWTIVSGRDSLDNLTLDDPCPGLIELGQIGYLAARKVALRLLRPLGWGGTAASA